MIILKINFLFRELSKDKIARAVGHPVLNSSVNVLELSGSLREASVKFAYYDVGLCHKFRFSLLLLFF